MLGRHGGGHRGGHRGGRGHGGRHGGRGRRGWGGGYPYYGYPYYDDLYYRTPDLLQSQSQPQIIVLDKGNSGINWPTIAISVMLSAFMLMRH